MNKAIKFDTMTCGDTLEFRSVHTRGKPTSGQVVELSSTAITYRATVDGKLVDVTIRRSMPVLSSRQKMGNGKFHWIFE